MIYGLDNKPKLNFFTGSQPHNLPPQLACLSPRAILSNLTFAVASGLRTHEVCMLDVTHINRERQELPVLTAKGDRPRAVPIPEALYTELLAYLLERGETRPLISDAAAQAAAAGQ